MYHVLDHCLLKFWILNGRDLSGENVIDVLWSAQIILGDFVEEKQDVSVEKAAFLKLNGSHMSNKHSQYQLI